MARAGKIRQYQASKAGVVFDALISRFLQAREPGCKLEPGLEQAIERAPAVRRTTACSFR